MHLLEPLFIQGAADTPHPIPPHLLPHFCHIFLVTPPDCHCTGLSPLPLVTPPACHSCRHNGMLLQSATGNETPSRTSWSHFFVRDAADTALIKSAEAAIEALFSAPAVLGGRRPLAKTEALQGERGESEGLCPQGCCVVQGKGCRLRAALPPPCGVSRRAASVCGRVCHALCARWGAFNYKRSSPCLLFVLPFNFFAVIKYHEGEFYEQVG